MRVKDMNGMDGHDIDKAIDEAARGMTAGEPGAAFTMRVMARVQRRPPAWSWRWATAPVILAAATAILVVALRTRPSRSTALSPSGGAPSLSAGALSPSRGAPSPSAGALSPSAGALSPSTSVSVVQRTAVPPSFVATLAPPPLDVPSMNLESLGAAVPLDVPAIAPIEPMTVAALDQPEGDQP